MAEGLCYQQVSEIDLSRLRSSADCGGALAEAVAAPKQNTGI